MYFSQLGHQNFLIFPSLCFIQKSYTSSISYVFNFDPHAVIMALKTFELLKGCETHEEIMKVLAAVAVDLGDVIDDVSTVEVNPLKGAMTNEVFEVNWPTKSDGHLRRVLVRLYGEGVELFFNRDDEIQTFESISKNGQGPRLLGRFTTGRVEEFIHARVCDSHLCSLK
jgi:choline/ethanolamine kinase